MIKKSVPGFCFTDPKNRNVLNLRLHSVQLVAETRPLRVTWTPELAADLNAFQNIDAEAELTAILGQEIGREIDREILQNLTNINPDTYRHLQQWNQLINNQNNPLIYHGHRPPAENEEPNFGNIILPIARRVAAQTMGLNLVPVVPLAGPQGMINYLDFTYSPDSNYIALPNEEGWYSKNYFESIFIKIEMKKFEFLKNKLPNLNWRTIPGVR